MRKTRLSSFDLLARLIPVDRLDEEGLGLYRSLVASDDERAVRSGSVRLLERLCQLGVLRRLSRAEGDGRVQLKYRNLLTLDTISISIDEADLGRRVPDGNPPAGPAALNMGAARPERGPQAAVIPESVPGLATPRVATRDRTFLRAVAASSRRTDLPGAIGHLHDLLRERTGAESVRLFESKGLRDSPAINLLEFEDIFTDARERELTPVRAREDVEQSGELVHISNLREDPKYSRLTSALVSGSAIVAPLKAEAYVYGTLEAWSAASDAFSLDDVETVSFVAEFAAGLIKRRLEVEELISIDQTCQIHNRRYFDEQLSREIERCKRTGNAMALLIGDLDDFKRINDTLGHAAGDSVLRQVGRILSENARQVDIVARYGGEEFGVILPGVNHDSARAVAERIRSTIELHSFITGADDHPTWDLTISIGGAVYPLDATSKTDLMDKADRIALYEAKRRGKNKVTFWTDTQTR